MKGIHGMNDQITINRMIRIDMKGKRFHDYDYRELQVISQFCIDTKCVCLSPLHALIHSRKSVIIEIYR